MQNAILTYLDQLVQNWATTLLALAAVGTISSALVELVKPIIRPWFHKRRLADFMGGPPPEALARATFGERSFSHEFYLLKREDMIAVLHSGLNTALDFPKPYKGSIRPMLGRLEPEIHEILEKYEKVTGEGAPTQSQMDMQTKLSRLIESRLSTFHKSTDVAWKGIIYGLTIFFSFVIILIATSVAIGAGEDLGNEVDLLVYWILGSLFAPVAHDLSSRIAGISKK